MRKSDNRRKYRRFAKTMRVTYQQIIPRSADRKLTFQDLSGKTQIQNLSEAGACLLTKNRLFPCNAIILRVPSIQKNLTIPTFAHVHWSEPTQKKSQFISGLAFMI